MALKSIGEAAKEEALKFGVVLKDDDLEHVIWEHTGYPCFWPISEANPTPEACFRSQVREWAEKESKR